MTLSLPVYSYMHIYYYVCFEDETFFFLHVGGAPIGINGDPEENESHRLVRYLDPTRFLVSSTFVFVCGCACWIQKKPNPTKAYQKIRWNTNFLTGFLLLASGLVATVKRRRKKPRGENLHQQPLDRHTPQPPMRVLHFFICVYTHTHIYSSFSCLRQIPQLFFYPLRNIQTVVK